MTLATPSIAIPIPHRPSGRRRLIGLALSLAVVLAATAVGVRARLDTGGPAPAHAAAAPALAPLYVLPEQPAARVAAAFVAVPARHAADWELNLMHAPHGR